MRNVFENTSVGIVVLQVWQNFETEEEKKDYALGIINRGEFKNCTIDEVYINRELVLENVKTN